LESDAVSGFFCFVGWTDGFVIMVLEVSCGLVG